MSVFVNETRRGGSRQTCPHSGSEGVRPSDDSSTTNQVHLTTLSRAIAWVKANPQPWGKFERHAMEQARKGQRVSVQWRIEDVRAHDYVDRTGEPCKVNNSYEPVFARLLVKAHPEIKASIELRKSVYDGLV